MTTQAIEQALWDQLPARLHEHIPLLAQLISRALAGEKLSISDTHLVEAIRQLQNVSLSMPQGDIRVGNIEGNGIAIGQGSIALALNIQVNTNTPSLSFAKQTQFHPEPRLGSLSRSEFLTLLDSHSSNTINDIRHFFALNPNILMNWISWRSGSKQKCLFNVLCEDVVIDFAVGIAQTTIGMFEWKLLLLDSPDGSYYTSEGSYRPHIQRAIERASHIRQTLQINLQHIRTLLPDIDPLAPVIIVSGRRANISDEEKKRITMLRLSMPGITLNSYDSILDSWKEG